MFQVPPQDTQEAVEQALEVGYRHIDTAQMYGNEAGVGAAHQGGRASRARSCGSPPSSTTASTAPTTRAAPSAESLDRLGLDQVDLFLIHWPLPTRYDGDFVSTWRTLVELRDDGRARSIGVSNFEPDHLERIVDETGVAPAVNQIEVHPYLTNERRRAADASYGVATEAWSPIARGQVNDDPTIRAHRRPPRAYAGPGDPALAHPARRHRLPQVGHPASGWRRTSRLFDFELDGRRPGRDQRARPRRGGAHRATPEHHGLAGLTPIAAVSGW